MKACQRVGEIDGSQFVGAVRDKVQQFCLGKSRFLIHKLIAQSSLLFFKIRAVLFCCRQFSSPYLPLVLHCLLLEWFPGPRAMLIAHRRPFPVEWDTATLNRISDSSRHVICVQECWDAANTVLQ